MGTQTAQNSTDRQTAIRWMLRDLQALEHLLAERMFETDITRIGAEQEMFLVDGSWRPSPRRWPCSADIGDGHFTTEVGAFNLELNLDPQVFTGDCLSLLEAQLDQLLAVARAVAAAGGLHVVLAGILPTIRKGDLSMENMVPNPRYLALNAALMNLRGEAYELHIKGTDELRVRQDSVMAEACNASFQVHLQVTPDEFVNLYNIAQLLAGPVLACATNSPVLFGKRLWAETRIALFEQSVDTRRPGPHIRDRSARVTFGNDWVSTSITELTARTSHASVRSSRPTTTRTRSPCSPTAASRRSRRCGCTRARCSAGTAAATASPTACRTCASRTACCHPGRPSSTRWPTPRCGWA